MIDVQGSSIILKTKSGTKISRHFHDIINLRDYLTNKLSHDIFDLPLYGEITADIHTEPQFHLNVPTINMEALHGVTPEYVLPDDDLVDEIDLEVMT